MKVSHQRLEGSKVELNVTVDAEQVAIALDKAYKKVVKEVKLPGFRVGHIPRKILESRFGVEVLYNDAADFLLEESYPAALDEAGIDPIDRPEITKIDINAGQPFTYTAIVTVKPEVELGQYTGLELETESAEVAEEAINQELTNLQQRHSQVNTTERTVVENGDYVIIDFEGFVGGEPFEGGKAEEYQLEIGSHTFIDDFEDQLIGVAIGEQVDVEVDFPADYRAENLAGKPALFKVTVKEIKVKEVPELNDDFAKEASEFETIEELKNDIKNKLEENAKERVKRNFENKVVDAVAANSTIEIPAKMVEDELENMYNNLAYSLQQSGIPLDKYLEYIGSSKEQWREENLGEAEKRVRGSLTLEAIAAKEGIQVTDEELDNKVNEIAEKGNQDPAKFKQFLLLQGRLNSLAYSLTMEKVIDFLVEKNTKQV